jgi:hypothetical protein
MSLIFSEEAVDFCDLCRTIEFEAGDGHHAGLPQAGTALNIMISDSKDTTPRRHLDMAR